MDDRKVLGIIYEEILDQWRGSFRTYQTIRERLGQIIAFIGIILNLELLGILQIFCARLILNYLEILVLSIFFIILSLIIAAFAYRGAPFRHLSAVKCLDDKFINKSEEDLIKKICEDRIEDINENKKINHQRATMAHVALYNLVIGILIVAIFIILNISTINYIILFLVFSILITIILYLLEERNLFNVLGLKK